MTTHRLGRNRRYMTHDAAMPLRINTRDQGDTRELVASYPPGAYALVTEDGHVCLYRTNPAQLDPGAIGTNDHAPNLLGQINAANRQAWAATYATKAR